MTVIRWVAAALAVLLLLPDPASAQEEICDPENPACTSDADEAQQESVEEAICDPENPACPTVESDDVPVTGIADPEPAPTDATGVGFDRARFLGSWGTQLDVDTVFEDEREDIVELTSRFGLAIEFDPTDNLRIVAGGEFLHWVGGKKNPDDTNLLLNARGVRASYDARLGEAYVLWRLSDASIAVGNLITRWGSTDLTRPGDVINPVDATSISAHSAAQRLPQLGVDFTYTRPRWSLQGLVVPFFVGDRAWAFGRDTSVFNPNNPAVADQFPVTELLDNLVDPSVQDDLQDAVGATRRPEESLVNVSLGGRLTATLWNADLGLGAWWGWDRTAYVFVDDDVRTLLQTVAEDGQVLQDLDFLGFFGRNPQLLQVTNSLGAKSAAGEDLFVSEHRRLPMLLVDVARYLGPIGVRADLAMFAQKTYTTSQFRSVRRPTLAPSVGLSWERLKSETDILTITVEGFAQKPLAADDPLTVAWVSERERGDPQDDLLIVGDGLYGVAAAFLWAIPWVEARLQLGGLYNITGTDFIIGARAERTFFDWLTASVGLTLFEGPDPRRELTLGGIYDNNDTLSFALSGVF